MTIRGLYWFWGHWVKGQGHRGLDYKKLVRPITWECFDPHSSYLAWRLILISRWPLLILRSLGQRSRLHELWLQTVCQPYNLRFLYPTVFLFGTEVDHDHNVTPIYFEVTGSKVTGTLIKKKALPLNCLRMSVRSVLILTFWHLKHVEYIT
jgi:hypothetical protein